jgi:hypothetical protein
MPVGESCRSRFDFRPGEASGLLDLLTSVISNPKLLLMHERGSICELLF